MLLRSNGFAGIEADSFFISIGSEGLEVITIVGRRVGVGETGLPGPTVQPKNKQSNKIIMVRPLNHHFFLVRSLS